MKKSAKRLGSLFLALLMALTVTWAAAPEAAAAETAAPETPRPTVTARGAIVIDALTGEVLYEKKAEVTRPAASMTKLMSLYLMYEEIEAGRLTMDTMIPASPLAVSISHNGAYSGLERLRSGGSYRLSDLVSVIMTASCNGSVVAIAEHIAGTEAAFVERMNAKAKEWGIDAQFADCTGFIDEGNAVSPHAMAEIARRLITDYPDILNYSTLVSHTFNGKTFTTTNRMLRLGSYEGIDGLKTGTTNGAGRCFTGTAVRDGRRVITVTMHSASDDTRVSDSRALLDYGFARMAELEAKRAANVANILISITTDSQWIYPYTTHTFYAALSNMSEAFTGTAQWEVNGVPVAGFCKDDFLAENGAVAQLDLPITGDDAGLNITLRLTDQYGHETSATQTWNVSGQLTFSGHMAIREIAMYPGLDLLMPVTVTCDQGVSCAVPVAWYLDGQPVPGYANGAFRLSPDGASAFPLKAVDLSAGEHTLSLVVNPEGLPGIVRTAFSTRITILSLESQDAA